MDGARGYSSDEKGETWESRIGNRTLEQDFLFPVEFQKIIKRVHFFSMHTY